MADFKVNERTKNKFHGVFSAVENLKLLKDFHPLEYGYERCTIDNWTVPRNCISRYMIFFVKSGKGYITVNNEKQEVNAGEGFIVKSNEYIYYEPDKKDPWFIAFINFTGEFAHLFTDLPRVFTYPPYLFDELYDICHKESMHMFYLAGFLHKVCAEFRLGEDKKPDLQTLHVNAAVMYINHHFWEGMNCERVAQFMRLSIRYLSRCFKNVTGKTLQEYIIEKKLSTAIYLLKNGASVAETAEKVGYNDFVTFSKAFKQLYGYAPSEIKPPKRKK